MGQKGKGRIQTSKKQRGETHKMDKDDSFSSTIDSDLTSSKLGFGGIDNFSRNTDGRHIGRLPKCCEGNNYESQASEEVRIRHDKEHEGEVGNVSQNYAVADVSWEPQEEESDIRGQHATSRGSVVGSMILLKAVQEALEKELSQFREIGREPSLMPDDYDRVLRFSSKLCAVDHANEEGNSSRLVHGHETTIKLNSKVEFLERKLEDTLLRLDTKKSKVLELEYLLNKTNLPERGSRGARESLTEHFAEMEDELEGLFKQKIETEIEFMAITMTMEKLKISTEKQRSALNQVNDHIRVGGETSLEPCVIGADRDEWVGSEEEKNLVLLKVQTRIWKYSLCFLLQWILLLLFVGFEFYPLLQQSLFSHSAGNNVPT